MRRRALGTRARRTQLVSLQVPCTTCGRRHLRLKIKLFDSRAEALNTSPTTGLRSLSGTGHAAQTLTFTLTADTAALSVHDTATQLAFTTQASGCRVSAACTTQPVVTIRDSGGRTVTTGANSVLQVSPGEAFGPGDVISVTSPVTAVNGRWRDSPQI